MFGLRYSLSAEIILDEILFIELHYTDGLNPLYLDIKYFATTAILLTMLLIALTLMERINGSNSQRKQKLH